MPTNVSALPLIANGNISCSVFVKIDVSTDFACLQCDATGMPIGISQKGADIAPGLVAALGNAETDYAARKGENMAIYYEGDVCDLVLGTGGCTAGDFLKPDANGAGVTTSTANDRYGAVAFQAGNAGDLVQVLAKFGKV